MHRDEMSEPSTFADGRVLNIDKPEGWTSFDVVKKVRSLVRVKKVGHAGTLDPFATGVLLVCTGRATKQVETLMGFEKEYVATIKFGEATDTYDRTGKVVATKGVADLSVEMLMDLCKREFTGEIEQLPPMFSALKINGERLYKLARQGITVQRSPRRVQVHEFEVTQVDGVQARCRIVCSKGTYVRSLAHDMGVRLGVGAHLAELKRTRIGRYKINDALTLHELATTLRRSESAKV